MATAARGSPRKAAATVGCTAADASPQNKGKDVARKLKLNTLYEFIDRSKSVNKKTQ
jgi:hypothetical protein